LVALIEVGFALWNLATFPPDFDEFPELATLFLTEVDGISAKGASCALSTSGAAPLLGMNGAAKPFHNF